MAVKTANVTARIQPEIKENAEAILEKLGIPVSVFIDMTYRQIINHNGIPFPLELPKAMPTRDILSDAEFNAMMEKGLNQAKADESMPVTDAFARIINYDRKIRSESNQASDRADEGNCRVYYMGNTRAGCC